MKYQRLITLGIGFSCLFGALSLPVRSNNQPLDPGLKEALLKEITPELKPQGMNPEDQKVFAETIDLNGDGTLDAIVVLIGSYWCGSGGCTMKVFHGHDRHFHPVSTSTLIQTPITVSDRKTNGWRDLIVEVSGGGIKPKKVALKYDGKKYPLNPSTLPEISSKTGMKGKVLFPEGSEPRSIR